MNGGGATTVRRCAASWLALAAVGACSKAGPTAEFTQAIGSSALQLQLVDYGVYETTTGAKLENAKTTGGYVNSIDQSSLRLQTDDVCARVGSAFGVRFRPVNTPPSTELRLLVVWTHPTMTNPQGLSTTSDRLTTAFTARDGRVEVWNFEHPYELVAGDWTISVATDGRELLRHTFHVRSSCTADSAAP